MKTFFWPAIVMMTTLAWTTGCEEMDQSPGPTQPPSDELETNQSPIPEYGVPPDGQSPTEDQSGQFPSSEAFPGQPQGEGQANETSPPQVNADSPIEPNAGGDNTGADDSSPSF